MSPSELKGEHEDIIIFKVVYNYDEQIKIIKEIYKNYLDFYVNKYKKIINNFNRDFILS